MSIMSYNEFQDEFIKGINESGIKTDIIHTLQVNREVTAVVNKNGNQVKPIIYMEDSYRDYICGKTMKNVVADAVDMLNNAQAYPYEIPVLDAEIQRDNLYCALINKNINEELLKKVPHQDIEDLDLSLVIRCKVGNSGSFLINDSMCTSMKLTSDELFSMAKESSFNTEYSFKSLYETIMDLEALNKKELFADNNIDYSFSDNQAYVLTNKAGFHGASLLASKQVLNEIQEKLNSNFYVLPSSIHEVIVISDKYIANDALDYMKFMVSDVNECIVDAKDKLSDNVYYYDAKTCKLSIADGREKLNTDIPDKTKTAIRGR